MNKQKLFSIALAFLLCQTLFAQKNNDLLIVSYNVENLFDTIDNPSKNDEDFLPEGKKKWNTKAYNNKLINLAKVISSVDSLQLPAIVALCEVENEAVVKDLISTNPLDKAKYEIVHFESIDPRGIDDALLFQKEKFKLLLEKNFMMNLPLNGKPFHHDFLYVKGLAGTDTLHVFVNHWKSRAPQSDSLLNEQKRITEATFLKSKTDSIFSVNPNAKIIILGDFNDTPLDKSILTSLQANGSKSSENNALFNLFYNDAKNGKGSYKYKDTWYMFDQIIVSNALTSSKGYVCDMLSFGVFMPNWIMYTTAKGKVVVSNKYSDHLPVYLKLSSN